MIDTKEEERKDQMCWEEQLSNDEYLDRLDRREYERSNPYE